MHVDRVFAMVSAGIAVAAVGVVTLLASSPGTVIGNEQSELTSLAISDLQKKQEQAMDDFERRNNFHQIRISEYKKYWGEPATDDKLTRILNDIIRERSSVGEFNPKEQTEQDWADIRDEFRRTNDKVVSDLVDILADEYDYHMFQVSSSSSSSSSSYPGSDEMTQASEFLGAHRTIASEITATSFPIVTERVSERAQIPQTYTETTAPDLIFATTMLGEKTEAKIKSLERDGVSFKQRHDVREVGEDKNTLQVLFSIIQCQQELRINAEDYMDATIELARYGI